MAERVDLSSLLEHAQWIRALATSLAREDEDDAVQEVWLAALRSPPDADRPARPWLAKVLQNTARKRFRDASTRARNEAATPSRDETTTPEDVVSRAELHRLVVEAMLELEEPFRQTLLLRFFDGLTSAELARRLSVPAGTVRWRLKEGLERLRVKLDEKHQGDREKWLLAVAPLLLPPAGPWFTAGVALMEKKTRLTVLAAVGLALSVFLGWSFTGGPSGQGPVTSTTDAGLARVATTDTWLNPAGVLPAAVPPSPAAGPDNVAVPAVALPVMPVGAPESARGGRDVVTTPSAPSGPAVDAGVRFALDKEGIRSAIRSALPDVRDCYESWLKLHPELGGKFVVTLTIDTDDGVEGRISRIGPLDGGVGLGHATMEGCVLASLADLRFEPPLAGPVNVTYPFVFASDAGR